VAISYIGPIISRAAALRARVRQIKQWGRHCAHEPSERASEREREEDQSAGWLGVMLPLYIHPHARDL
jgi:hypothetical protein